MTTYKVGDRVRVIDNSGSPTEYKVGEVLTVSLAEPARYGQYLQCEGKASGMFSRRFTPALAPSLADDLRLPPQGRTVLNHMRKQGSISAADAMLSYGMTSAVLTRRVCDIENIGYVVTRESKKHPTSGRRYTRYSLAA